MELIQGVHGTLSADGGCRLAEIELSQAGPLTAWSVGHDEALVGTDVSTCRLRTSTIFLG